MWYSPLDHFFLIKLLIAGNNYFVQACVEQALVLPHAVSKGSWRMCLKCIIGI